MLKFIKLEIEDYIVLKLTKIALNNKIEFGENKFIKIFKHDDNNFDISLDGEINVKGCYLETAVKFISGYLVELDLKELCSIYIDDVDGEYMVSYLNFNEGVFKTPEEANDRYKELMYEFVTEKFFKELAYVPKKPDWNNF